MSWVGRRFLIETDDLDICARKQVGHSPKSGISRLQGCEELSNRVLQSRYDGIDIGYHRDIRHSEIDGCMMPIRIHR